MAISRFLLFIAVAFAGRRSPPSSFPKELSMDKRANNLSSVSMLGLCTFSDISYWLITDIKQTSSFLAYLH